MILWKNKKKTVVVVWDLWIGNDGSSNIIFPPAISIFNDDIDDTVCISLLLIIGSLDIWIGNSESLKELA